ncbi:MAG: methyltransferase domain-containing protein [Parvibaculaceae bacterium]
MSNPSTPSSSADGRNFDAEIEYTFGFFPFLKPDNLMITGLLQGVRPPVDMVGENPSSRALTFCELGCGQGVTLNVLAAGNEAGRYVGVDYNPAHIGNARLLAENAGLKNVEFIEASFADLKQRDLPDFDFVVLHGIYSWVTEKLRQDIVDFLDRKLKPGGLCFVSYNCTIGRGADLAFRELLQTSLRREAEPSPAGVARALGLASDFAGKGARYFSGNAATLDRLKDAQKRSATYVFHEFFNPVWTPFFFHEVAADMARAQLSFVGETNIAWNNPDLSIPSTLRGAFERHSSVAEQELLKGIWTNQAFRRDIYVKGTPERLSLDEQVHVLERLHYGLARKREDCTLKVAVPAGVANLPDKPFTPLLDALEKSPVSGERLRRLLPEGAVGDRDFVRALIILFGAEYAELRIAPEAMSGVKRRFDQLNAGIARCVDKSLDLFVAATPKNGLAIKMNDISYFLYRARQTGPENVISKAYRLLTTSGRNAYYNDQEIKDRQAAETIFAKTDRAFIEKILPRL